MPPRGELIDRVRRGEITPKEAEDSAVREGLGPLARSPDPDDFNPLVERWWSLPMTIAWIVWRSIGRTRQYWDLYRSQCWEWVPSKWQLGILSPSVDGHELRQLSRATRGLLLQDSKPTPFSLGRGKSETAEAMLKQALGENRIQANGVEVGTGQRCPISPNDWSALEWIDSLSDPSAFLRQGTTNQGYLDVALRCSAVVTLWEAQGIVLDELPETVVPTGPGHMPLSLAAQWIATQGGKAPIAISDSAAWEVAFAQLLAHIASGGIAVIGVQNNEPEQIDPHRFVALAVDRRFCGPGRNSVRTEQVYLVSYPFIDDAHWRNGFDDSIWDGHGVKWSRLMVPKPDVLRFWPFHLDGKEYRSGVPGRPSSIHLIEAEFRDRCESGVASPDLNTEAKSLADWLVRTHPTAPRAKAGTIANQIREAHRRQFPKGN